jgi:hypothetical protein
VLFMTVDPPGRHAAEPYPRHVPPSPRDRWRPRPEISPDPPPVERYYPQEDEMPTDPTMPMPLNFAPRGTGLVSPRYQDLVVPRVYVEPDEALDKLRARALRWGIARDVLLVAALLYAVGWMTRPLWSALF